MSGVTTGVPKDTVAGVTDYSGGSYDPEHASDPHKAILGAPDDILFRLLLAHQPRSAFAHALTIR